jgi:3'-5' exoribonuclease
MDKITKIYTLEVGVTKELTLLVMGVTDKISRFGDPFAAVELFDGIKKITVSFFNRTASMLETEGVVVDTILKVKLTRDEKGFYNQGDYRLNDDDSITKADFKHMAPINPDDSFAWLMKEVEAADSNPNGVGPYKSLSYLTQELLKKNEEAFKRSSAAVTMHHNFISGLLYHTVRMVSMAEKICKTYTSLDKELLVCGTALHDIGKVSCYETKDFGESEITVEGRLLDHAVVGILMIHDAAKLECYDPERIQMLEHMIASHHGKKEWDAITTPAFPEAEMLHLIDMMDSRMNMFEGAYKGQFPGTISAGKVFGLENSYIYKPSYCEL